jgi:hypothetical protein
MAAVLRAGVSPEASLGDKVDPGCRTGCSVSDTVLWCLPAIVTRKRLMLEQLARLCLSGISRGYGIDVRGIVLAFPRVIRV